MHFLWQAMDITYLMYMCWMFTFQHLYEAVYAGKNQRSAQYVLFENILDFIIMFEGMIYITVVYKVYRYNTFLSKPEDNEMAELFWENWERSTRNFVSDQVFLVIIDFTFLAKAVV
jgi:hypothetical protein